MIKITKIGYVKLAKKTRILLTLIIAAIMMMAITSTAFGADILGPIITEKPVNNTIISTVSGGANQIIVLLNDSSGIDNKSASLVVDGKFTPFEFVYNRTNTGIDDYNNGYIIGPNIQDGQHTAQVTVTDKAGNTNTKTWNFTIAVKPAINNISPPDQTQVKTNSVDISAKISDPDNGGINVASIVVRVDDNIVPFTFTAGTYNSTSGILTATVSNLIAEKAVTLAIEVADNAGNVTKTSWTLTYNPFGDMSSTLVTDCKGCHQLNSYNKYTHNRGPDMETSGGTAYHGQQGTCGHCHKATYQPDKCDYCHNGQPWNIAYGIIAPNPQLQANRSCLDCHGPTGPMVVKVNNSIAPAPVGTKHDLLPLHQISTDCAKCHSYYLTRTHNRNNKAGQQMDCNTCHQSSNPKVQLAIASKNKDCSACHDQANHEAVHISSLDIKCQSCHNKTISTEHLSNPTTAGKNFTCGTCHDSTAKEVKRTIANHSLNCAGCHKQAHNINLSDSVPSYIPIYSGFQWSSPLEASIFTGEPTTPDGYVNGQIIVSNRLVGVTGSQIWDFYNQQLSSNGWTLKSSAPATEANLFSVNFEKSGNAINIRAYSTENNDGSGSVQNGWKLEIWYK